MSLQQLPFKDEISRIGGKIFSVGGAVRDEFLGKESKDLDILITGVPLDNLEVILRKYGKVDAVGKSFGVIKFKPHNASEEIDIAIPRTEFATGDGGHKDFDVSSDHTLPIEKDLERRDFTINAIAKDIDGNLIDPFNGQADLKNKIIRMVNPNAFGDDPLRMLRAIQFASRFGFEIEPTTFSHIRHNANKIKNVSPERILIEFDKVVKKGNPWVAQYLLRQSGLYQILFGDDGVVDQKDGWSNIRTMGEFFFLLTKNTLDSPSAFYKNKFKGDIDTFKEMRALELAFKNTTVHQTPNRMIASAMKSMYPASIESGILPNEMKKTIDGMKQKQLPFSLKELRVNGNDMMQLGLKGEDIGVALKTALAGVLGEQVPNEKEALINFLNKR